MIIENLAEKTSVFYVHMCLQNLTIALDFQTVNFVKFSILDSFFYVPPLFQERDQLRKDLDELTRKIRGVIKDFPALAYRLGFLQNFTDSRGKYGDTPAPVEEERVAVDDNGAVGVVEEVAAVVVDGGEKEAEREGEKNGEREEGEQREWSRGGFLDHNEVDEAQLDNILQEVCFGYFLYSIFICEQSKFI